MARDLTSVGLMHRFVQSLQFPTRQRELIILARGILRASLLSPCKVSTSMTIKRVASLDQTDPQAISSWEKLYLVNE